MNSTEIKKALALVASQPCTQRAWVSFGVIHAATNEGLFSFRSLDSILSWVEALERGASEEVTRIIKAVERSLCTVIFPPISSGANQSLAKRGFSVKPDSTVFIGGVKISKP